MTTLTRVAGAARGQPAHVAHASPSTTPEPTDPPALSALYLTELFTEINAGAGFLDRLNMREIAEVRHFGQHREIAAGESVFCQGEHHTGIFLIETGRIRTYYAGPNGREITLAYWTPGHFVGGPDLFGGTHIWSGIAVEKSTALQISGPRLRRLAETIPALALCLIDGLIAKGKCYSALVQMLGTRSVTERLAQLLLILGEMERREGTARLRIARSITHEHLANMVGSTRQWVTITLARFQRSGLISIDRTHIHIEDPAGLRCAA